MRKSKSYWSMWLHSVSLKLLSLPVFPMPHPDASSEIFYHDDTEAGVQVSLAALWSSHIVMHIMAYVSMTKLYTWNIHNLRCIPSMRPCIWLFVWLVDWFSWFIDLIWLMDLFDCVISWLIVRPSTCACCLYRENIVPCCQRLQHCPGVRIHVWVGSQPGFWWFLDCEEVYSCGRTSPWLKLFSRVPWMIQSYWSWDVVGVRCDIVLYNPHHNRQQSYGISDPLRRLRRNRSAGLDYLILACVIASLVETALFLRFYDHWFAHGICSIVDWCL